MRKIDSVVIHCSATAEGSEFRAKHIDAWHKERGFERIGYHYVVCIDGTLEQGRPIHQIGAHCTQKMMNHRSIGICYIGGLDKNGNPKDTRTPAQKRTLKILIDTIKKAYPEIEIYGHRDLAPKACPCFDARKEYS